jgi:hypothetical protein
MSAMPRTAKTTTRYASQSYDTANRCHAEKNSQHERFAVPRSAINGTSAAI